MLRGRPKTVVKKDVAIAPLFKTEKQPSNKDFEGAFLATRSRTFCMT